MNIKSVLRIYSQLRNLTDDETALLETLRRFTDAEREAFVEAFATAEGREEGREEVVWQITTRV
jgi:Ser/Thr protein kinase RdoA (MazF antagonist)